MARRNAPQCLPDTLLECGAAHVQWQVNADVRCLDHSHHLRDELFECGIAANKFRPWKTILQFAQQSVRIVTQ